MNYQIKCEECGQERLITEFNAEQLARWIDPHYDHTTNFELKIFNHFNECQIIHSFTTLKPPGDSLGCAMNIVDCLAARIKELKENKSKKTEDQQKNCELREQIEGVCDYISQEEEKLCREAKFESIAYFHRGRQLLAIDMLKTINRIFHCLKK